MKYKLKRKRKTFKVWYILLILIVIIISMSTSYSLWNTNLYIRGNVTGNYTEPELPVDIVKPSSDRLTTNSDLTGGWFGVNVFRFESDTVDGNTVTTSITNGFKTWITERIKITFSMTLQNNSGSTYTEPIIQVEEYDPSERIFPASTNVNDLLSVTTVLSGNSVTLTAELEFIATEDVEPGSYVNYKISFLCNGIRRYYNYKILISE